jgi:hypothetical protein
MGKLPKIVAVILILSSVGCVSDLPVDPNYPTIVKALDGSGIDQLIRLLEQTSMAGCVAIDTFGISFINTKNDFCLIDSSWRVAGDYAEIENRAKQAFFDYALFFRLDDPAQVQINSISTLNKIPFDQFFASYPDSLPQTWQVSTGIQTINGLELRGTNLRVLLSPNAVVGIGGAWFQSVYIPASDNFNEEGAKESLINKTIKHGSNTLVITDKTIWNDSKKIIVPMRRSEVIELRVCWALYPKGWETLVDSQTGEVISSTKISN